MNTAENTFAALTTGLPYTAAQMSKAIYNALANWQTHTWAGGDTQDESLEISWHEGHQEWQFVRMVRGVRTIEYDQLYESALADEDPELLYSLCDSLDLLEDLQAELEDQE